MAATPAARAAARKTAAVSLPPKPPTTERNLEGLVLRVVGRQYRIGRSLTGEAVLELTMDGASTVTLNVHDPERELLNILASEELLLNDGARIIIDGIVYVLASVTPSEAGVRTLVFEDEVTWRLRQFSRYLAVSRNRATRAEFIQRMADEAGAAPLAPLNTFIPELHDKRPIASPPA
jgi:hypothetical protein